VSAFESHWVKSNGERLLASGSLTALRDSRRDLEHIVITASDVTQRREVEGELRAASLHDDLTGLYNRRGFVLLAEQRLVENRRSGAPLALVFADIDGIKAPRPPTPSCWRRCCAGPTLSCTSRSTDRGTDNRKSRPPHDERGSGPGRRSLVWVSADLSPRVSAPGSGVSLLAPAGSRVQYAQGLD
jgi:hypothetical protein